MLTVVRAATVATGHAKGEIFWPNSHEEFMELQAFMVEPVANWSWPQALLFPWLFVIPAEILGLISSSMIYLLGSPAKDLPHGKTTHKPLGATDLTYIWFN